VVRAHKDVFDYLGIEHTFLTGKRNEFCTVLELSSGETWIIAVGGVWEEDTALFNIKYRGSYLSLPVTVEKRDGFTYRMSFREGLVEPSLREGIIKLEENERLWNKRKDERFAVGVAGSEPLGLKKAEQKVILSGAEYPCMVNDLSFNGAKITTLESGELKRGSEAGLLLDFINPLERIVLTGTVQALQIKSGEQRAGRPVRFAILSLRYNTDPPLAYRRRLGSFAGKGTE
jgi:hypothetical protein